MNSWFISILILNHVLLSSFSSSILHHDSALVIASVLNVRPVILWWSRNDQKRGLLYHDSIGHSTACKVSSLSEKWVVHEVKSENILNIEINFLSKIVKFPVVPTSFHYWQNWIGKRSILSPKQLVPLDRLQLRGVVFRSSPWAGAAWSQPRNSCHLAGAVPWGKVLDEDFQMNVWHKPRRSILNKGFCKPSIQRTSLHGSCHSFLEGSWNGAHNLLSGKNTWGGWDWRKSDFAKYSGCFSFSMLEKNPLACCLTWSFKKNLCLVCKRLAFDIRICKLLWSGNQFGCPHPAHQPTSALSALMMLGHICAQFRAEYYAISKRLKFFSTQNAPETFGYPPINTRDRQYWDARRATSYADSWMLLVPRWHGPGAGVEGPNSVF